MPLLNLRELRLTSTRFAGYDERLSLTGLHQLFKLTNISELTIESHRCWLDEYFLFRLSELQRLRKLVIVAMGDVTDRVLHRLCRLPLLREIELKTSDFFLSVTFPYTLDGLECLRLSSIKVTVHRGPRKRKNINVGVRRCLMSLGVPFSVASWLPYEGSAGTLFPVFYSAFSIFYFAWFLAPLYENSFYSANEQMLLKLVAIGGCALVVFVTLWTAFGVYVRVALSRIL